MKTIGKIILFSFICCALACSSSDNVKPDPIPETDPIPAPEKGLSFAEIKSLYGDKIRQDNQFALDLLKAAHDFETTPNLLLSPLSVSMALGMTVNGAAGDTHDEMLYALRVDGYDIGQVNDYSRNLYGALYNADPETRFSIANSIWYKNGFPVKESFIEVNRENYFAEVNAANFSDPATLDRINEWVARNTEDKIPNILDHISPAAVMYLVNAVYLNAQWESIFDVDRTSDKTFTSENGTQTQVPTMVQGGSMKYTKDETAAYLELPYKNNTFSMILMLPDEGRTVGEMIGNLDGESWEAITGKMHWSHVVLNLPRFKYEADYTLSEKILPYMGMHKAFNSSQADFSGISDEQIFISRVIHKTFIEVNEEGTEAAGATIIEMELATDSYEEPVITYFTVDRPFAFAIRDNNTGVILFIGKVGEIK